MATLVILATASSLVGSLSFSSFRCYYLGSVVETQVTTFSSNIILLHLAQPSTMATYISPIRNCFTPNPNGHCELSCIKPCFPLNHFPALLRYCSCRQIGNSLSSLQAYKICIQQSWPLEEFHHGEKTFVVPCLFSQYDKTYTINKVE